VVGECLVWCGVRNMIRDGCQEFFYGERNNSNCDKEAVFTRSLCKSRTKREAGSLAVSALAENS
jgi:hypothetical protein